MKKPPSSHRRIFCLALATVVISVSVLFALVPSYALDQSDLRASLKTLLLLTVKPKESSILAVLYNPHDHKSRSEAEEIVNSINNGDVLPEGLKLNAQSMSATTFAWIPNVKVAFLTQGVTAEFYDDIARTSAEFGVLTISADLACVKAHKCVLGIETKPSVEIYYSPAAAEAAHITFTHALVMLAEQV